jgi:hypothetical protein
MSDWLERELARQLAPVAAPDALSVRLGFAAARRREISRAALAVAAAIVLVVSAGYATSRSSAFDLYRNASRARHQRSSLMLASTDRRTSSPEVDRPMRCDGGAGLAVPVTGASGTVLLAHSAIPAPAHNATADAGCNLCHSL